ncbi:hypothetical protein [Chitinophaga pinensis]|nr:hypothetical protein [Chitinophaga pinensis]
MHRLQLILITGFAFLLLACSKSDQLLAFIGFKKPAHFPSPV